MWKGLSVAQEAAGRNGVLPGGLASPFSTGSIVSDELSVALFCLTRHHP